MPLFSIISAKLGLFFVCNETWGKVATFPYTSENRKCCFGGVVSVGTGRDLSNYIKCSIKCEIIKIDVAMCPKM